MYMYYNKTIEKEQNTDRTKQEETKMKVKFTDTMKDIVTVAEMPAVRKVIEAEKKNDEWTVQEWAKMAAGIVRPCSSVKVLEASAEIAKNCRIWDAYADGSADFDVWIRFTAFANDDSFVIGGAYLTDLWAASADNREETISHMYIRRFKEVKG